MNIVSGNTNGRTSNEDDDEFITSYTVHVPRVIELAPRRNDLSQTTLDKALQILARKNCSYCNCAIEAYDWYSLEKPRNLKLYFCGIICMRAFCLPPSRAATKDTKK